MFQGAVDVVVIMWTLGGRLRSSYNATTSATERRRDRIATLQRALLFGAAAAFMVAGQFGFDIRRLIGGRTLRHGSS